MLILVCNGRGVNVLGIEFILFFCIKKTRFKRENFHLSVHLSRKCLTDK